MKGAIRLMLLASLLQLVAASTGLGEGDVGEIELLSNGGFEQGTHRQGNLTGSVPKFWRRDWSGKGTVEVVEHAGAARSGKACVQVEDTSIFQRTKVSPGYQYRYENW